MKLIFREISSVFVIVLSAISLNGSAQSVSITANNNTIRIGEQVKLKLAVENAGSPVGWFILPDSIPHLEIVGANKIDTVKNGKFFNYYQTLTLTSFDSGRWNFPALVHAGLKMATLPVEISVMPVDVSQMQDYHDIKDIEEVAPATPWVYIIIIALLILLIAFVLSWWYRKKKKVVMKPANGLSPLEWALKELDKLDPVNIKNEQDAKTYYSAITNIAYSFFDLYWQKQSLHQTTSEWMINLQDLSITNEVKIEFFQVIRLADAVKFAKFQPPVTENENAKNATITMVKKVSLLHNDIHSPYYQK